MAIVGFNFTRMEVERNEKTSGKISIKNNVTIKDIEEINIAGGKDKQNALKFMFEFSSLYEPKAGKIILNGNLLFMSVAKKMDEVMSSWKKDKKIPKEVTVQLFNSILTRCNIQALILSQQAGLPPPIRMPTVEVETPK